MFSLKTMLARLMPKRSSTEYPLAVEPTRPLAPLRRPPVLPSRPAPKVSRKAGSFGGQS